MRASGFFVSKMYFANTRTSVAQFGNPDKDHGKCAGSFQLGMPLSRNSCGILFSFKYCLDREIFGAVPTGA